MICVILPQSNSSTLDPSPQTQNKAVGQQNMQQSHTVSVMQTSSDETGSSSSHSACELETEERMEKLEGEEAVGPYIPEPMLCSEAEQGTIPHSLEMLFQSAQCHNSSDCLLVAAHLLLLEIGFLPQGCVDTVGKMPSSWRATGGIYRLQYTHPHYENSLALVVAVPMGQALVINATLKMSDTVKHARKIVLKPVAYVTEDWADGNAGAAYKDLKKLSRIFKDQLAYPLIAIAREVLGLPALFGLAVLPPELLLRILRLLDVHSVILLSAVCTHLHSATQDPTLWRHLLHRDFRVCIRHNSEHRNSDCKELYKRRYKQRKELSRCRVRSYPYSMPPIYPFTPVPTPPLPLPLHPPGIIGGEYDERLSIPHGIFPPPRYGPTGLLPGHVPDLAIPPRRSLGPSGSRPADIRRGFI
ncbi:F-box only protein 7 isoform X2 [Hoplias malabaricus]